MGKNVWYHTFDMFNPEVVSQGLMLNQPAVYQEDFTNPEGFLTQDTGLTATISTRSTPIRCTRRWPASKRHCYQSEIARRPSPITQDWYDAGPSGTVALQLWKQGIIRRGGPADIMGRRFVMPPADDDEVCITESQCESCTTEYRLHDYVHLVLHRVRGQRSQSEVQPESFVHR
jgi:hypothetical protein